MSSSESVDSVSEKVIGMLSRVHVLVIGPGLGRDKAMQETCARVIKAAREKEMPVVVDADGLMLVQEREGVVDGYEMCILTPNVVELGRLCKAKGINVEGKQDDEDQEEKDEEIRQQKKKVKELARVLGGVTVIAKGNVDVISNGKSTLVSRGEGGKKRSGGQGDTLTGALGTMLAWRKAYMDKLWTHEGDIDAKDSFALVAYAGSAITRECSRLAFKEKGRSLQAGDLTEHVHQAFLNTLGEPGESKL